MVLAFATMAGFLYWLNLSAASTQVEVVEDPTGTATDFSDAVAVTADSFGLDPAAFSGRTVRLVNLPVSGLLGAGAFFVTIETLGSPYLIRLGAGPLEDRLLVFPGDVVSLTGVIGEMSEELAAAWVEAGAIGQGEDMVAMINPTFITATDIEIMDAPAGG